MQAFAQRHRSGAGLLNFIECPEAPPMRSALALP
jgi:hypothetical protein